MLRFVAAISWLLPMLIRGESLTRMKGAAATRAARPHPAFVPCQFSRKALTIALLISPFVNSRWLFSQQTSEDALLRWMNQIAQEQLARREAEIATVRNVADAERRKQFVHQTLVSLL